MGTTVHLYPLGAARPLRTQSNTDVKVVFGTFVFSSSYVSGGESLTAGDVGLEEIFYLQPTAAVRSAIIGGQQKLEAIDAVYDYTNSKMLALGGSAAVASAGGLNVEVTDNADLSGFTVKFIAAGRT